MTSDQLKSTLLSLANSPVDFSIAFSGKRIKRINGFYTVETRTILIHDRNFTDDNLLLYTAIHEYAHHLHAVILGGTLPAHPHSPEFMAILHRLITIAEDKGIYRNVFNDSPELIRLSEKIRNDFLTRNGTLLKELGATLIRASEICVSIGGRFEDYLDRVLRIPRVAANLAINAYNMDLNPAVGPDNMRFLAGIKQREKREEAEAALLEGESPATVRVHTKKSESLKPEQTKQERLIQEKARIALSIEKLQKRLDEIDQELAFDA
ncbi:hypothetical protein FACS1894172_12790 [Spirochaetia bacterium]|nr:hypothetical protein FACS1894164_19060 [Spirochaetia bacterium]GHU33718.1 hypothetical protein FACS1894172_12790 [Spirochaetia bacterium]